mgnify:CR=1 FL=1
MTVNVTNRPIRITTTGGRRSINIGATAARSIEANRPRTEVAVVQRQTQVQVTDQTAQRVDTGGRQGLPGRDGQDAGLLERRALVAIGGHRVVRSVTSNLVELADARQSDHGDDTLGITTNAAAVGDTLRIQRGGTLAHAGWTWTPQEPVFLAGEGMLTQVPPDPEHALLSQVIGFAESPTSLVIDIQPPIYF